MFNWFEDAKILGWNGFRMVEYPTAEKMFATEESAAKVAQILGLKYFEAPAGQFGAYTRPLYMVNRTGDPMSAASPAGLLAKSMTMYGSDPNSLGYRLAQRDIAIMEGTI